MEGANCSSGFSVLLKDTLTCSLGELGNQQPQDFQDDLLLLLSCSCPIHFFFFFFTSFKTRLKEKCHYYGVVKAMENLQSSLQVCARPLAKKPFPSFSRPALLTSPRMTSSHRDLVKTRVYSCAVIHAGCFFFFFLDIEYEHFTPCLFCIFH